MRRISGKARNTNCHRNFRPSVVGSVLLLLALSIGCGDEESDDTTSPLVFTRENGSTVEFSPSAGTYVWCGPWEAGNVLTPTLHVFFGSMYESDDPRWELKAVYGDVSLGDTLRFPNTFIWDTPDSAHVFLFDPPNELATDLEDASGWIVFQEVPCLDAEEVEFEIDVVLRSETAGMPWVAMRGGFRHAVTGPPPWLGKGGDR